MINNKIIDTEATEVKDVPQKPITVARQDFINDVVGLINGAGLPAFMLVEIFKDITAEMSRQANEQYENDKRAYEAAMKEGE